MSFTFDIIINPIVTVACVLAGAIVGFGVGRVKLAKNRAINRQLENELMSAHKETLEAQRAYVALERGLEDQTIPVISIKVNSTKENPKEKASK